MPCRKSAALFLFAGMLLSALAFAYADHAVNDLFCDDDYRADYEAFWDILDSCYPFWGPIGRLGIDKEAVKAANRDKLEICLQNGEGFEGFAGVIRQSCRDLQNFAHLSDVEIGLYDSLLSAYKEHEASHGDWLKVLNGEQTATLYARLRGNEMILFSPDQTRMTTLFPRLYLAEKIGYIKISSFDFRAIETDSERISRFYENTKDYDHIIIDITGNGGGSSVYWQDNIVKPLGGSYRDKPYCLLYTESVRDNLPIGIPQENLYPIEEMPSDVILIYPEDKKNLDFYAQIDLNLDFDQPQIEHRAKRWVLVDEVVYSAAEEFARFCKGTGWATLIGRNTRGDGLTDGGPTLAALPKTGLLIRFTPAYGLNHDGSCNAESGTAPDIICEPWETPLTACFRILDQEGASTYSLRRDRFLKDMQ